MAYIGNKTYKPSFVRIIPAYCVNIVLLFLSMRVVDFVSFDNVHVIFFMVPLFYWTIHAPFVLPLWFVFLSGLMIDFSVDALLGLHAFTFVMYYMILYRVRRIIASQPYMYHVMIYALSVTFFEMLRWCVLGLLTWQMVDIFPSVLSIVLNIVAFMPLSLVLRLVHRVMSGNGRQKF